MMPGMNPRQVKQLMKQLGIKQEEVNAIRVIIELSSNEKLVFNNPSVVKIDMMGQETFQITGSYEKEENKEEYEPNKEDVSIVIEKTNCSEQEAREALIATNGDIAEAIQRIEQGKE
ncbi:nascent polypeptide-associated complex protein [Candidatus Woesearchaeota archaeon]|nr:nascent polypeptide-associated complex protein [Candidatus Woesearchaeota archaeon]